VTRSLSGLLTVAPVATLAVGIVALAWREQGSVLAEDWLAYALAAGLLVATVLVAGTAVRPPRGVLVGLGALAAYALWNLLSASWSPVPALARDEALLVLFYGLALSAPVLTLRSSEERAVAVALVVAAAVFLVIVTSVRLVTDEAAAELFWGTRLGSPIRYPGADAALFLVGFWPAVAAAAHRRSPVPVRVLAFAGSVALLAGLLLAQSRAGAVALAVSASVVFAVAPVRMRLFIPVALAAALVVAAYEPLTRPFREEGPGFSAAIEDAGAWALALPLAGLVVGLAYALADRRRDMPPRFVRAAGATTLAALALGALAGLGGYLVTVDQPVGYLQDRWDEFKREPEEETGSSHLLTIGSNRYDFWRVALDEFRDHPLAGAGARAFGSAYLREGQTSETPQRAHSLELDLLGETGVVGFFLLAAALLPFIWIAFRRARISLIATGVLGALAYWLVHASGDWTWTFPAVGLPFFLLLGVGAAGVERAERLAGRAALPAGIAIGIAAVLAFAPPWLSSRYTASALEQTHVDAADELRWARRLDPLSVDPLIAEAELAPTPAKAIPPLERALDREPDSVATRYLLGLAYMEAGRRPEARRHLREALTLAPRSGPLRRALARAEEDDVPDG
jgi:tetratricopeptide (TPR) repeat protein